MAFCRPPPPTLPPVRDGSARSIPSASSNKLPRLLIIGYGNPLRGDDAFGWLAAERLRASIHDPDVEILAVHQLAPELMESISRAERVIFLDAQEGSSPGDIRERRIEPQGVGAFTHSATPEALLGGAIALYGRAPEAFLISVTGADFSLSEKLSAPVFEALEKVMSIVRGYSTLPPRPLPPR